MNLTSHPSVLWEGFISSSKLFVVRQQRGPLEMRGGKGKSQKQVVGAAAGIPAKETSVMLIVDSRAGATYYGTSASRYCGCVEVPR